MAEIAVQPLAAAARALLLAGRWDQATELLAAAAGDDAERAVLAVAEAEVAVDQDFWCRTDRGASVLARASTAVASAPGDPVLAYDLEFLRLRQRARSNWPGRCGSGRPSCASGPVRSRTCSPSS